MVGDSIGILGYLVRTGIWASTNSLMRFRRVVIDVDSLVTFLYKQCVSEHLRRQRSIISTNQLPDLYSATLVNYVEFARLVKQFFDHLVEHNVKPILVYEGKFMEAPLFGLTSAKFKRNLQRMSEVLSAIQECEKQQKNNGISDRAQSGIVNQLGRPNLALNIFKSIVNIRRRAGADIQVHQAFYSSYPVLAKLARDFNCPVLTNNSNFIIMDVRAGFVLIEEFWFQQVELDNLVTRDSRQRSNSSFDGAPVRSPRSVIKSAGSGRTKSAGGTVYAMSRFHYNSLFLRQHPGLNARLAINLFPFLMFDFVTKHSASLKRLRVYDTDFQDKDFVSQLASDKLGAKQAYKSHHLTAKTLEMVLTFLAGKPYELLGNLIRGEAARTKTSFDEDYLHLTNYYSVAYNFKHRLRFILQYMSDPNQLNYIEWCLINRECTSEYLLALLCCSIGRLASVSYNRWIQLEDLGSRHSAYSLSNRSKSMLMSLFSSNKSRQGEHSVSISKRQEEDTVTRYSTAALTIVDRDKSKLNEHTLTTTHEDPQFGAIRDKLQLAKLAARRAAKQDCIKFINMAFKSSNLIQMPAKLELLVNKFLGKDEHHIKNELAIVRSLYKWSFLEASLGDDQFKASYSKIDHHFELAIVNHYIFLNQILAKQKHKDLLAITNIINRQDFENVSNQSVVSEPASKTTVSTEGGSQSPKAKSPKVHSKEKLNKSKSSGSIKSTASNHHDHNQELSKQIRHLIELLNGSLEAYCELNSFLDYPLPRLNLHLHYNPILIFNLTSYSCAHANGKALLRF